MSFFHNNTKCLNQMNRGEVTCHSSLYRKDLVLAVRSFNINTHACAMWGRHLSFMGHLLQQNKLHWCLANQRNPLLLKLLNKWSEVKWSENHSNIMIMISKAVLGLNFMYSFSWCPMTETFNEVQRYLTSQLRGNKTSLCLRAFLKHYGLPQCYKT